MLPSPHTYSLNKRSELGSTPKTLNRLWCVKRDAPKAEMLDIPSILLTVRGEWRHEIDKGQNYCILENYLHWLLEGSIPAFPATTSTSSSRPTRLIPAECLLRVLAPCYRSSHSFTEHKSPAVQQEAEVITTVPSRFHPFSISLLFILFDSVLLGQCCAWAV